MSRTIDFVALDELKPDPRNPKGHALETIDSSVGRFGFLEPIVLDGRTGLIVSGHGRREALAAMEARGDTPPDGVTVDTEGRWLVPVTTGWSSKDDTEAAGALIALNRAGELGGWVDEALLDLLGELAETKSFDGVGYTADDLDDLRARLVHEEPDLDGLAEEWAGGDMTPTSVAIKLTDPELIARWRHTRAQHETDEAAMFALLGE